MRVVVLLTGQRLGKVKEQLPSTSKTGADSIEMLRDLLSTQQQREVGYNEAKEIGTSLVEFYEVLAEEIQDDAKD